MSHGETALVVLGVDPGATTGWVAYDADQKLVLDSGEFRDAELSAEFTGWLDRADRCVLERPRGQGPTRPQVVECGIVFGMLYEKIQRDVLETSWLYRLTVCQRLTFALHGTITVRNDATAWAALVALHGANSDSKGRTKKGVQIEPPGAIGRAKGHGRAALAVAVASLLPDKS
jgi:hypothetical protein